jgi:hypothetical protein
MVQLEISSCTSNDSFLKTKLYKFIQIYFYLNLFLELDRRSVASEDV